jgi:flagellar hook assembly protein FlgD
MKRDAVASLRIYNAQGRLVRTLLSSFLAAGPHSVSWNGLDDRGRPSSSGVYFIRLQAGGEFLSRTVNLLK